MNTIWVNWILQAAIMITLGIIAYFLKDMKKQNEDRHSKSEEKIEKIEKDFNDFKEKMPYNYVLREDFIRAVSAIDTKLDKIYDLVALERK